MSGREVVTLGTASQVPTRTRAHHSTLLRFDGHTVLFDPGEGTQRQLIRAGIATGSIDRICITHAHGDHCLGLPGVLQRISLDGRAAPVDVYYPSSAEPYIARLRHASAYEDHADVRLHPCTGGILDDQPMGLRAAALSHAIDTLGYRLEQPAGNRLHADKAAAAGVFGPARRELLETGAVSVDGRRVHLAEVSEPRPGRSMAFVMDTRRCEGALELADNVDLLVIEATFTEDQRDLAEVAGHLTAAQAARIAVDAGAKRVVLTHFSQRYHDLTEHLSQAQASAPGLDIVAANDLDRFSL